METPSKELLKLERKSSSSTSSLESALLISKAKDSEARRKQRDPNGKLSTSSVPTSQVLGKVRDFLGIISEANKKLQADAKDNPENYDIEALDGNESEVIEMDLMLGVADLHTPEAVAAAESAVAGLNPVDSLAATISGTESEDSSDDDDDDSDDNDENSLHENEDNHGHTQTGHLGISRRSRSDEEDLGGETRRNRTRKQPKKRPKIVELS